eukprot:jgi/Psemu1/289166/fgenesh1_pg.328_\
MQTAFGMMGSRCTYGSLLGPNTATEEDALAATPTATATMAMTLTAGSGNDARNELSQREQELLRRRLGSIERKVRAMLLVLCLCLFLVTVAVAVAMLLSVESYGGGLRSPKPSRSPREWYPAQVSRGALSSSLLLSEDASIPTQPLPGDAQPPAQQRVVSVSVLIVYLDDDPGQEQMAKAAADGARSVPGVGVTLSTVSGASFVDQVLAADGVILGSSVENGNTHPDLQRWINEDWAMSASSRSKLTSTVGGAFATAGGMSAGEEGTLASLLRAMMVFGMIVVGGSEWTSAFGASAVTGEAPFRTLPEHELGWFPDECYESTGEAGVHPMDKN